MEILTAMKKKTKKPLTTKQKWIMGISIALLTGSLYLFINWINKPIPNWRTTLSFDHNRYLVTVDQTYKQHKSSQDYYFLIQIFDFKKNQFLKEIKVDIPEGEDYRSKYLGYGNRYIWFKSPELTALDMLSPDHKELSFAEIKKRIFRKNPGLFTDIIETGIVGEYLTVTNQNGDEFYLNTETFVVIKESPESLREANQKAYSVFQQLPDLIGGDMYASSRSCSKTIDEFTYELKLIDESNRMQFSVFRKSATETAEITVTATDSTQVAIQYGDDFAAVNQTIEKPLEEMRLTSLKFLNALGIAFKNNILVFRYQKSLGRTSDWYIAWFDLKTKSIVKEFPLASKGLNIETEFEELTHWTSLDGKYAFFTIENKAPVRIRL